MTVLSGGCESLSDSEIESAARQIVETFWGLMAKKNPSEEGHA